MYEKQNRWAKKNSQRLSGITLLLQTIKDEERDSSGLSGIVIFLQTISDEMKDIQELTGTKLL